MPDETRAGLNGAVRQLFGRIAPAAAGPASIRRPAVWETAEAGHGDTATPDARRRADAHAAYRAVQDAEPAALDAALAVVEAQIVRLRRTVLAYGEALKEIEVYGADPAARSTAAAALKRAPERLGTPRPVPHLGSGSLHG